MLTVSAGRIKADFERTNALISVAGNLFSHTTGLKKQILTATKEKKQVSLLPMNEIVFETARISFVEGILIIIGILWALGLLRTKIYVPVVVEKEKKSEPEKNVIIKDSEKTIYRTKEKPDESYTDFEEINS